MSYHSAAEYRSYLAREAPVPRGFHFFTSSLSFVPPERPDAGEAVMKIAVIESDPGAVSVGVTTRNRFCGAPVVLARERLPAGVIRAVVINNKVANVATAGGLTDARAVAAALAGARRLPEEQTLSVSTGVIGWSLPTARMVAAVREISSQPCGPVDVAEAIMTTDRYPKMAWARVRGTTCLGIAKGAGMIEPNLATMLGFIMCDARVQRDVLDRVFRRVVERTFNTISVDGDQSTSDMVLCTANGAAETELSEEELEMLLEPVCRSLSREIVRNGEGTAHVIEVHVRGVPERTLARKIATHVVNSPLVKTAIYGNDPNVGRILAAVGDALDTWDPEHVVDWQSLTVTIADREVFRAGAFRLDGAVERELSDVLKGAAMDPALSGYPQDAPAVPIIVDFSGGVRGTAAGHAGTRANGRVHESNPAYVPAHDSTAVSGDIPADVEEIVVVGSDLSYEYIRENADYRT
ncbi:MAG: bifunctional ornithine acetyltransferase/N-acetylglutamate synthase [Alkalispirochaeta sp.]